MSHSSAIPSPETMRVVEVEGGKGDADALRLGERPIPRPGPGEIIIRVRAAGVNRPDVFQRRGAYPPPPGASDLLGLEGAGEVAAVGEGAARWRVADRVCALLPGGGYAQYARCDARHALPIPQGFTWVEAAALPETVFTVWANVFDRAGLKAGETLMVHGATSGIGLVAIALAKAQGAKVIATGRGPRKAATALRMGADVAVDSTAEDFVEVARREGGADVVLDMVGGGFTPRGLEALNPDGRLVLIATQAGASAEIDLAGLMRRRLTLTGSTLRPRSDDAKAAIARHVEATVWPWIAQGRLRPTIDRVFALADAAGAHRRLESGDHVGKVVLAVDDDAQAAA